MSDDIGAGGCVVHRGTSSISNETGARMIDDQEVVLITPKVLVVDDEKIFLELLQRTLSEEGYDVSVASEGDEAIAMIEEQHFDLVITDLKMPKKTGLDVLAAAREMSPSTLVVIITGYASLDSAVQAIKLGAYDYIAKPFQIDEIRITARNALETQRLTRQNEMLLARVAKTQSKVDELLNERVRLMKQLERLDRQIESRSQELMNGVVSLRAIPKGVMLQEFAKNSQTSGVLQRLSEIIRLKENGNLSDDEFKELKRTIFAKL